MTDYQTLLHTAAAGLAGPGGLAEAARGVRIHPPGRPGRMMTAAATTAGTDAFIARLRRCGIGATVSAGIVVFTVVAVGRSGPLTTQVGVAAAELEAWPAVPPHWVHLPAAVQFAITNINADETLPGWVRHSRQVNAWGDAEDPAQAWMAHLRRILLDAA